MSNTGAVVKNRAHTLLEVIIVVSILALMLQLSLPAIQQARESARQTLCQSRQRQVALALQNHHDRRRSLPAGSTLGKGPWAFSWGYAAFILSDLELDAGFDRNDLTQNCDIVVQALHNRDVAHPALISLPVFQCPSDPTSGEFVLVDDTGPDIPKLFDLGIVYPGNYLGVSGDTETTPTCHGLLGTTTGNGLLYSNSRIRFNQVRDGLSKTFMLGERAIPTDRRWGWLICGGSECEQYLSLQRPVIQGESISSVNVVTVGSFSSYHPAGVHFALADGAIRALAFGTDVRLMQQMATRDSN